jgi:hypothetical protein
MSRRSGNGPVGAIGRSVAAGALAGMVALVGVAGVGAQATPVATGIEASPAAGPCEAPEGTPQIAASPVASPVAADAAPAATPVDDEALIDDAVAAAENLANCWNAGDLDAVLGLVTPNLLQTKFGVADAEEAADVLGGMEELPPYTILEVGDVQAYDDGRASLDLDYLLGDHQYTAARWYMVEADGQLLIDEEELLLPQPDVEASSVIGVLFADDESPVAFGEGADEETGGREVALLPAIVLNADNTAGTERRFLSVVQVLDESATPTAGELPEGEFVAQIGLAPGDQADVALVNLQPGTYAIGEPGGESIPLTITEADAAA